MLGVEDDGTVSGIQSNNLEKWVYDTVFEKIHPSIIPFYEEIPLEGDKRVAVITVSQGTTKPYVVRSHHRESIYIRIGSSSRLAKREQQMRLYQWGLLHPELLPVSGSGFFDLSHDRLKGYLTSVMGDAEVPRDDIEWYKRLQQLGFMCELENKTQACTIAGLVLFGHSPRRFQRQAGVRWMAFPDLKKDYGALDDRIIDDPLVALSDLSPRGVITIMERGLFENIIEVMRPFVSEESKEIDSSLVENVIGFIQYQLFGRHWLMQLLTEIGQEMKRLRL